MFTLCMSRGSPPLQDKLAKHNGCLRKQVKEGFLLRYKRGLFCTGWYEEWIVLYDDSTLAWYTDKTLCRLRGFVRISDAPELLAVAEWTRQVPRKPRFPRACHIGQLMAVGCTKRQDVHWLMGQSPSEINNWMTAISNTLPPPPNISMEDTQLSLTQNKSLANGYAKPIIANGCATIIPTTENSSPCINIQKVSTTPRINKCCAAAAATSAAAAGTVTVDSRRAKVAKKNRKFDNDHTVLAGTTTGVVMDWGHGWGWATQTPSIAPQISFAAETYSSSLYCHAAEDFSMTGYDDVDWSSFGDFCF